MFSTFFVRVLTAAVYGTVFLVAILFGRPLGLGIVLALLAALASAEFYGITRREHRQPNEVFGMLAATAMPVAAAVWGLPGVTSVVTVLLVAAIGWHVVFRTVTTSDTAITLFGAVYIGFALAHFVLIRELDAGTELALATIVSIWANDVFAYLLGSATGRHKMAPKISPNKSWEGFAAGTLGTIVVWGVAGSLIGAGPSILWYLVIGVALSLAAVVGDLAESRLKREAGVKDSGRALPGHGGFLDRIDSLLLASVVAYYLLVWAGAR
ncbi:MAG: CDP-archaeol synthase [Actinomycetota bacterium]|nr:CDP-archaeol synthase [Actinomycetota bacterium]